MGGGDYPSNDFDIEEDGGLRRIVHLPTGMIIETKRASANPLEVSSIYRVQFESDAARPGEITQAALRHLRVWLMRKHRRGMGDPPRR